jgi:hypothetical protein
MLLSLLYFTVRRLLGARSRLQDEEDIELLVLRHQVKVLQRQVKRPRLRRSDRLLLAAASRAMPRGIWSSPSPKDAANEEVDEREQHGSPPIEESACYRRARSRRIVDPEPFGQT